MKKILSIITLVLSILMVTASMNIAVADCPCNEYNEYEDDFSITEIKDVSEQYVQSLKQAIERSRSVKTVLDSIDATNQDIVYKEMKIIQNDNTMIIIPVDIKVTEYPLLIMSYDQGKILDAALIETKAITNGYVTTTSFSDGTTVSEAHTASNINSLGGTNIAGATVNIGTNTAATSQVTGMAENGNFINFLICNAWFFQNFGIPACVECYNTQDPIACAACGAAAVGIPVLCCFITGLCGFNAASSSALLTTISDIQFTQTTTTQINYYSQETGEVYVQASNT